MSVHREVSYETRGEVTDRTGEITYASVSDYFRRTCEIRWAEDENQ